VISKQHILERAAEWHLRPEVVEKDYVLGWVLAAIAGHPQLRETWVFKGGTCLKKCYFETYRFSEDLDFSLLSHAAYTQDELLKQLQEVVAAAHEMSGIEMPVAQVRIDVKRNKQGQPTFQARIAYRGPLAMPNWPRLLLDITQHEPVIDPPAQRPVFHAYPDAFTDATTVAAYSLEELFAEKTRALYERTRPRDLYDVVQLVDNYASAIDLDRARDIFHDKCTGKGIAIPTSADLGALVRDSEELGADWTSMLANQLPALPPLEAIRLRLGTILAWVDEPETEPPVDALHPVTTAPEIARSLPEIAARAGEEIVAPAGVTFWRTAPLELVRFAGANRLMIEFDYNGKHRKAEPYSLRRAGTGNLLLYARERDVDHVKAFKVDEISRLAVSNTTFDPRYPIDLNAISFVGSGKTAERTRVSRPFRAPKPAHGPTYVFQCPYCQKTFRHRTNDPSLRSHKRASGQGTCSGRRGFLLRIV
jgi:predicted nucleotidyltransferase component of viral defense system